MQQFQTPVIIGVAVTVAYVLGTPLILRLRRERIGTSMMLVGSWMAVSGAIVAYIGERITLHQMDYQSIVTILVSGLAALGLGLALAGIGGGVAFWRYSIRVVEHEHCANRAEASMDLADIEGGLEAAQMPAAPMFRNRRRPMDTPEFETSVREFPYRRPAS